MAKRALEGFLDVLLELGRILPKPTKVTDVEADKGCVMLVVADVANFEKENTPVKKTLTIPRWLDKEATNAHLNFSGVLKEALIDRLSSRR
jgi:hypothetical protein